METYELMLARNLSVGNNYLTLNMSIEHFRKPKHIAATFFGGIKGTTLLPSQYRKNKTGAVSIKLEI